MGPTILRRKTLLYLNEGLKSNTIMAELNVDPRFKVVSPGVPCHRLMMRLVASLKLRHLFMESKSTFRYA